MVAGGHRTATVAARLKDRGSIATDLSPHAGQWRESMAKATAEHRIMNFVVEYGSQALHHIGTVLGPTSGAKGTVPLSV